MGLMTVLGRGRVGVDTAIFVYFIEEHPQFARLIEPLFRDADQGHRELVTSVLTLFEVLLIPYRSGEHLLLCSQRFISKRNKRVEACGAPCRKETSGESDKQNQGS